MVSCRATVEMVQAADFRDRDNLPHCRRLNRPRFRCVTVEALMAARRVVVIREEIAQQPLQVSLVEHDDVIEQVSADRADEPLDVWILPGRSRRRDDFRDAHACECLPNFVAVATIAVADQIARRRVEGEGFAELLNDPAGSRVGRRGVVKRR